MKLIVRENGHPIAQQEIALKPDAEQSETILFNAGAAGAHSFQIGIEPRARRTEQRQNNAVVRLVNVDEKKMRILYFEGEPRWEYQVHSPRDCRLRRSGASIWSRVVRTTQNKTYQQGGVAATS